MIFAFVLLMGKKYKLLIESDGKLLFSPRAATVAGATAALGITVSTNHIVRKFCKGPTIYLKISKKNYDGCGKILLSNWDKILQIKYSRIL